MSVDVVIIEENLEVPVYTYLPMINCVGVLFVGVVDIFTKHCQNWSIINSSTLSWI